MDDPWLVLLDCVLRPARPNLERCLRERVTLLALRAEREAARAGAVARCIADIDAARRAVFAADDGVVGARMTELEREWRRLSRQDPEAGLMDAWARLVSPASLDRKRWRDSAPSEWLDVLVALAADEANVWAAEHAVGELHDALSGYELKVGRRVRFRFRSGASEGASALALLAAPRRFASGRCADRVRAAVLARAGREQERVRCAALERFPVRPQLAEELGQAASLDFVWRAAGLEASRNPALRLRALWATGYVLSSYDASSATLEIPPLA